MNDRLATDTVIDKDNVSADMVGIIVKVNVIFVQCHANTIELLRGIFRRSVRDSGHVRECGHVGNSGQVRDCGHIRDCNQVRDCGRLRD